MGPIRPVVVPTLVLALVLASAVACASADPGRPRQEEQLVLLSAVNTQLVLDPRRSALRALVVQQHGHTVLERYDDWSAEDHWDLGALTSTVVSTLVGIAIGEGLIGSLDDTLGTLLPDRRAEMSTGVARTTLRELLTMKAGFAGADRDRVLDYMAAPDPLHEILAHPVSQPGRFFEFSRQEAHVLGAVLARATGTSLLDYARSRLLDPLGIDTARAWTPLATPGLVPDRRRFTWAVDRDGLETGWGLLALRPGDLARIGQLYLAGGRWHGRRIVPAAWVRDSTRRQVEEHAIAPEDEVNAATGFGYGWWTGSADGAPAFFATDVSGQLLEVVPERSLVVVVQSEPTADPSGPSGVSPSALTFLVDDVIAPALARPQAGE